MDDLLVVVADADAEIGLRALLSRREALRSLGCRDFTFKIIRTTPRSDNAVRTRTHKIVQTLRGLYSHILVFLDLEGSGAKDPDEIEREIKGKLVKSGWKSENVGVIAFIPELETWIWSDSPIVAQQMGWENLNELKEYISHNHPDWWAKGANKPKRPKEALEKALRMKGIRRSSSIYREIASRVSLKRCSDSQFRRLIEILKTWFPG